MIKILIAFIISAIVSFADKVEIPYKIIYAIAGAERSIKKDVGYPYIIGINKKTDIQKITSILPKRYFLNRRAIDCKDLKTCTKMTSLLIKHNIKNLDLGAFQLNYRYHKLPIKNYFILPKAIKKVKEILLGHINRYGYNLKAIASYHSKTPVFNKKYQKRLKYYLD
jgi:hypothetical protein